MGKEFHQTVLKSKLILQNFPSTAENYLNISKANTFLFTIKEKAQEIAMGVRVGLILSAAKRVGLVI